MSWSSSMMWQQQKERKEGGGEGRKAPSLASFRLVRTCSIQQKGWGSGHAGSSLEHPVAGANVQKQLWTGTEWVEAPGSGGSVSRSQKAVMRSPMGPIKTWIQRRKSFSLIYLDLSNNNAESSSVNEIFTQPLWGRVLHMHNGLWGGWNFDKCWNVQHHPGTGCIFKKCQFNPAIMLFIFYN